MIGDKVITYKGRKYRLLTTRDAKTYSNLGATRRVAQKWIGKGGKVLRIRNTYMFAVYAPFKDVKTIGGRFPSYTSRR